MSYSIKGVGSYYLNGLGADPAESAASYTGDCDIATQFDPDYVATLINKQLEKTDGSCGSCNRAGKAFTYYIVGALWRLGYSQTGFQMTLVPKGYVSWAQSQGSMWNAWRRQALGSPSPNDIWPTVGNSADIGALRKMKEQLLAVQAGTIAPPGPYAPKVVCIVETPGGGISETAPATCPSGTTGTPPNCVPSVQPAKEEPAKCPAGYTGTPPNCKKITAACPPGYELKGGKCIKIVKEAGMGVWPWLLLGAGVVALAGIALTSKKTAGAPAAKPVSTLKAAVKRARRRSGGKAIAILPAGMRVRRVKLKANRRRRARRHAY